MRLMTLHLGPRRGLTPALITSLALSALFTQGARADEAQATKGEPARSWPTTLDLSAYMGGSIRLGGASSRSLAIIDRTGLSAGGGIMLAPSRLFSVGIDYEHVDLGAERLGGEGVGSADVRRDAHALWADLRVHPLRRPSFSIFADLGLGLAWQRAEASGVAAAIKSDGGPSVALFRCEASAPASVGLRAKVGLEVPLAGGLLFMSDATLENARLSGELLDACFSGAGTTSLFALHAGIGARLDLSTLFK